MPRHEVTLTADGLSINRTPLEIRVLSDGRVLGQLLLSRGGIQWKPPRARHGRNVTWERLAELMDQETSIRAASADSLYMAPVPLPELECPRCTSYTMIENPEDLEGCDYLVTHQCVDCGMPMQYERMDSQTLEVFQSLLDYWDVADVDDVNDRIYDATDGHVSVDLEGSGYRQDDGAYELILRGAHRGTGLRFPCDAREIGAVIATLEFLAREDWRTFTGEAARRLIPLSQLESWGPGADSHMPDGWWEDKNGDWHPPED